MAPSSTYFIAILQLYDHFIPCLAKIIPSTVIHLMYSFEVNFLLILNLVSTEVLHFKIGDVDDIVEKSVLLLSFDTYLVSFFKLFQVPLR